MAKYQLHLTSPPSTVAVSSAPGGGHHLHQGQAAGLLRCQLPAALPGPPARILLLRRTVPGWWLLQQLPQQPGSVRLPLSVCQSLWCPRSRNRRPVAIVVPALIPYKSQKPQQIDAQITQKSFHYFPRHALLSLIFLPRSG